MGPVYLRLNRGKRSASWDMKSEKGKRAVRRLLETSDVFISTSGPMRSIVWDLAMRP